MRDINKVTVFVALALVGCGRVPLPATPVLTGASAATFTHHQTFRYIGKRQTFKVPAGITEIKVVAIGGEGGGKPAAHGGRVSAIVPVTSREKLFVRVAGNGTFKSAGYNGGGQPGSNGFEYGNAYGGGGASDIREGGDTLANRILVVGGGGGQGGWDSFTRNGPYGVGGKGGGLTGGTGKAGFGDYGYSSRGCSDTGYIPDAPYVGYGGCPGSGGTQSQGGSAGIGGEGFLCYGTQGSNGALGIGGQGGSSEKTSSSYYYCGGLGGGGGGGYYGGGGGGEGASYGSSPTGGGGGGGGGSSYVEAGATGVHMWQGWKTNPHYGLVVISW